MDAAYTLEVFHDTFAICRMEAGETTPEWVGGPFTSVTRTADEVSVVCRQQDVPGDVAMESGFRCMRVRGPLDFAAVGLTASLSGTLADEGIGIFVVSTFDTDYLLVREVDLGEALYALFEAGYEIV